MKRPALPVAAALVAASIAVGACGVEPAGSRVSSGTAALKGAELAADAEQVLGVVNFAGGQCTGAPITPNLVLTARHCIGPTDEPTRRVVCTDTAFIAPDSAGAMFVVTAPSISNDTRDYHAVRAIRTLPGDDTRVCGRDVALLELKEPLDVVPLIPRVDAPALAGEPYTAYGYGDDEGDEGAGIRRRLDGLSVGCVAAACSDRMIFATEWVGSDGVCSGDSGGPALDASGRILGVVSRGFEGCRAPVYGSVPAFGDFIKSETLLAAEQGGYEPPAWALGFSTEPRFYHPVGARCDGPADCSSGLCSADGYCTRECSSAGPCPRAYACDEAGGTCVRDEGTTNGAAGAGPEPEPPADGPASSCTYGNRTTGNGWLWILAASAALGTTRRKKVS